MKSFITRLTLLAFLFSALSHQLSAQVSIDIGDIAWPTSTSSQVFRRNAANNGYEFVTLDKTAVGLGNVANVDTTNASNIASGTLPSARLPSFTLNLSSTLHATPVTFTAGVGTATLATQSANTVFAGPASGAAATPTFRALTQADTQAATAANRNALAPRGGVAHDGTSGTGAFATLTGQSLGSDAFSVVMTLTVPLTTPSARLGIMRLGSAANTTPAANDFSVYWESGSTALQIRHEGGNIIQVANVISTRWAGKSVSLAIVKTSAGTIGAVYLDGEAQTVTGTNSGITSVNSTVLQLFQRASGEVFSGGKIHSVTLYNLALSATDVQEIYELGGRVPDRFKWGSQTALTGNPIVNGIAGNSLFTTFSGASDTGFSAADSSGFHAASLGSAFGAFPGVRFRVKATLTLTSGGAPSVDLFTPGLSSMSTGGVQLAAGNNTVELTASQVQANTRVSFYYTGATNFALLNVLATRLGAVVHLDSSTTGLGYQWRDSSTNALHADRTAAGTSWTHARDSGRQTLTYTFAHSAISSTAATTTAFLLPPNTVLREVQLNRPAAFDASTTLDIGISGTPTKFVSATSVAGTGFTQVASSSLVPESASAATTVYVKKNQATTTGSVTLNFIIEAVGSPTQ